MPNKHLSIWGLFGLISLSVLVGLSKQPTVDPEAVTDDARIAEAAWEVIRQHCIECHGSDPARLRGGLSLMSRAAVLEGGDRGPAIDALNPAQSHLLEMISHRDEDHQMPPDGRLPDREIALLTAWVQQGAPWPAGVMNEAEVGTDDWWAYQPVERPAIPSVEDEAWATSPIDAFVLSRLEQAGLRPSPEADRVSLIRRATYDLTGLPPTLDEIQAFVADDRADAYARVVDRLLASPHYGEKWGRHWLDLVRYAETDSYERDRVKPHAWRYRDYVIAAFNDDKPYDRFLIEQLAGDEIPDRSLETIIATGYYRLGIWDDEPTDLVQAQFDDLDGIVDTTSRVMLGMSMSCARCHEHKGDPIPQRDYYRMLAFFRGIKPYKQQLGNDVTRANFLQHVPVDLGLGNPDERLAEFEDRRETALGIAQVLEAAAWDRQPDTTRRAIEATRQEGLVFTWSPSVAEAHDIEQVEGRRGLAARFNGHSSHAVFDRPVQDDLTISFWFRTPHQGAGGQHLSWPAGSGLVDGEVSGVTRDFGVSLVGDGYIVAGTGAPDSSVASAPRFNDNRWHHVAFTRHRESGRLMLFVDGRSVAEAKGNSEALDAPPSLTIGRLQRGGNFFRGDIEDVRIYERALGKGEIEGLYLDSSFADRSSVAMLLDQDERTRYEAALHSLFSSTRPGAIRQEVLAVQEVGQHAPSTHVLIRGNAHAPGREVVPGFPSALGGGDAEAVSTADSSGRRLALARWMTKPDNIATSRVMANRIWQYHFGRGLIRSPNDFGRLPATQPTHPQLLDWLASEFVDGGWSIKSMHRKIMLSSTYRMSSRANDHALAADPINDLLWRFDMRRLSAEELRDSILALNDTLNLKMGGPGVYPPMPEEVLATSSRPDAAWGRSPPEEAARRTIYVHVKRSLLMPLLTVFDLADTDSSCPVRFTTTQPTQALTMLNSEFINEQARLLSDRLRRDAEDLEGQVRLGFHLATGREASDADVSDGLALIRDLQASEGMDLQRAMDFFSLMVLNLNEFVYLD